VAIGILHPEIGGETDSYSIGGEETTRVPLGLSRIIHTQFTLMDKGQELVSPRF
jgi:hypothetical protein